MDTLVSFWNEWSDALFVSVIFVLGFLFPTVYNSITNRSDAPNVDFYQGDDVTTVIKHLPNSVFNLKNGSGWKHISRWDVKRTQDTNQIFLGKDTTIVTSKKGTAKVRRLKDGRLHVHVSPLGLKEVSRKYDTYIPVDFVTWEDKTYARS